jgi:hypothetical protein
MASDQKSAEGLPCAAGEPDCRSPPPRRCLVSHTPIPPRIRPASCLTSASLARPPACQRLRRSRGGRRATRDMRACCHTPPASDAHEAGSGRICAGFSTSMRPASITARSTSGAVANGATVSDRRRWRSCGRRRQACPLAAGSASFAARSRRASRQGFAVLLRAGSMARRSAAAARQRVAGSVSRGGARRDDRRPHIAQSRAGKAAGRSSDRPSPQP